MASWHKIKYYVLISSHLFLNVSVAHWYNEHSSLVICKCNITFPCWFPLYLYREILPEKHAEYFEPWIYSFSYELIIQSTRLPFISGFYKLLSIAMNIAKKTKYFKVRKPSWRGQFSINFQQEH